jgi:U3 small nucleolar RNA-associated protein 3
MGFSSSDPYRLVTGEHDEASGPRSVTRAIMKNKGLTPHRSKSVRNPRVKKRQKYEQAKKRVSSQRAVYKGGIGDASKYTGEQSGISKVVKSVRLG